MKRVAIIGLGLMGASLGLALRRLPGVKVAGYARREANRKQALACGAADEVFSDPCAAVRKAGVVILCLPIRAIPKMIARCRDDFEDDAIITDVGSTKGWLMQEAQLALAGRKIHFIGSHPIAGSEQQGLEAARADLYAGVPVIVTPTASRNQKAVLHVREFWRRLGAHVITMPAAVHDRIMARTSHLPHLAAAALAQAVVAGAPHDRLGVFCGPGFRDSTRVAEGAPEIWADIVATNRKNITGALTHLRDQLGTLLERVGAEEDQPLQDYLVKSRNVRRQLMDASLARSPADVQTGAK